MAPVTDVMNIRIERKIFPSIGKRPAQLVLKDVEFRVERGSFVAITGPSGCGKSTLLNIIAGLDPDYEGSVDLGNTHRLGYVFQTPRLLPWRTVEENIALVLPEGDRRRALVPELVDRVGLAGAAHAYPERLSVGMQRRVALARGFVIEPDILLMDEPFVSLDGPTAEGLRRLLIDLWNRRPTTVLFVTHDRTEAVMLATRILRLTQGPATIAEDVTVSLSQHDRSSQDAVKAERKKIFGDA